MLSKTSTSLTPVEDPISDDLKLLLYQSSITIDSIGHTAQIVFKALEQLYCLSVWE
jgi:hypothetical protein